MTTATQADPKFALRLAEANLLRARARQYRSQATLTRMGYQNTTPEQDEESNNASAAVLEAEAELALVQAEYVEHSEEPTEVEVLVQLRDLLATRLRLPS